MSIGKWFASHKMGMLQYKQFCKKGDRLNELVNQGNN